MKNLIKASNTHSMSTRSRKKNEQVRPAFPVAEAVADPVGPVIPVEVQLELVRAFDEQPHETIQLPPELPVLDYPFDFFSVDTPSLERPTVELREEVKADSDGEQESLSYSSSSESFIGSDPELPLSYFLQFEHFELNDDFKFSQRSDHDPFRDFFLGVHSYPVASDPLPFQDLEQEYPFYVRQIPQQPVENDDDICHYLDELEKYFNPEAVESFTQVVVSESVTPVVFSAIKEQGSHESKKTEIEPVQPIEKKEELIQPVAQTPAKKEDDLNKRIMPQRSAAIAAMARMKKRN
jgi:hypothetical protein